MESLHTYIDILGLFDMIILTSIIVLSIILSICYKKVYFICTSIPYLLEIGIRIYIDYYNLIESLNSTVLNLLASIITIKTLILIWFNNKMYNRIYINILLIIVTSIQVIFINYDYVIFTVINIISNILIIRYVYIESIKNIMNKFIKNKYKLEKNRQFISKSIEEIESQANLNDTLNESIENLNNEIRYIIDNTDTPVFILDNQNSYIYGNKEFENLLDKYIKYTNTNNSNFYKNKSIINKYIENNLKELKDSFIELSSNKKNLRFKCIKDDLDGKEIKICTFINNISNEFYANNLIIKEYENIYNNLLEKMPDGIAIIDKNSRVHKFRNKAMINILKYIGIEKFNEIINEYINKGNYNISKNYNIRVNKNIKLNLLIRDFIDYDNMICYMRVINNESTYKKLSELNDMYSFKNEFLYTISKNLSNPINIIFEANKRLQKSNLRKKYNYIDSYSKMIKQNSYRLKRLLDNVEEINKIEKGAVDINYSSCNIVKFIENIVNVSREYAKLKNIDIEFYSNVNRKFILIDESKIERIILNLLSNAMKFTNNNGKIIVSINVDKDETIISVEDTGVGIKNENLEIIFDNFVQLDTSLYRNNEGTGIGLALVKNMAQIHNAEINVYSKFGEGSRFELKLKNSKQKIKKSRKLKYNFTEMIDIEFSDIYFDIEGNI